MNLKQNKYINYKYIIKLFLENALLDEKNR